MVKLVSWNCHGDFLGKERQKQILDLQPDIAIIQDCPHPGRLRMAHQAAVWAGNREDKGLAVLCFSENYQLSILVDEMKYEWVVPIQVSGPEHFILLAVWARRMPGFSYGRIVYAALKEYGHLFQNQPALAAGDFNIDKNVSSSFSGVKGARGFDEIVRLFEGHGMVSCYHHLHHEEFGAESQANYYHQGKSEKPFHIHYCFASQEVLDGMQQFYIGSQKEWASLGYHLPFVLESSFTSFHEQTEKIDITPDDLKEKYRLFVGDEPMTDKEVDEAIRYIKALRILNREESL